VYSIGVDCQGQYFLVRDVSPDDDKLGTLHHFLAPNVSEASHGFPVYGLGQPTMNGIRNFVQALKDGGKKVHHLLLIIVALRYL